jgi:hypothetical protein
MFHPRYDGIEESVYQNGLFHARKSLLDIAPKPFDINGYRHTPLHEG